MATYTRTVQASTDDGAFDVGGTGFSATGTNFVVGDVSTTVYDKSVWLRFTSVTIPAGSGIGAATLTIPATGGSVTPLGTVKIQAEAADNPAAPSNRADAIARTRTTAAATWSGMTNISSGSYTTSDFAAVLQEVISRTGWVSGNAVQIFLTDNTAGWSGTAWQIAFANFNTATSSPATLNVTYYAPRVPTGTPNRARFVRASHY